MPETAESSCAIVLKYLARFMSQTSAESPGAGAVCAALRVDSKAQNSGAVVCNRIMGFKFQWPWQVAHSRTKSLCSFMNS